MLNGLFCMRLHTAGKVVGWLQISGSILGIIYLSIILSVHPPPRNAEPELIIGVLFTALSIHFLFAVLLIVGTHKNRHSLLLPWLILNGIGVAMGIINLIFQTAFRPLTAKYMPIIAVNAVIATLNIYIYYGIYSLYKHIQATRNQERSSLK
ncbi:uncharacterized protein LOC111518854 [Drosophila willistoni]|uniref:uncharacterized protein LOC111518854 n=1 Tax=Drosophila willistoni TaxID=7260 RepID=UPI001F07866B|nr:uncharacterized protein LOC111518854 [Drosophila willistoni]